MRLMIKLPFLILLLNCISVFAVEPAHGRVESVSYSRGKFVSDRRGFAVVVVGGGVWEFSAVKRSMLEFLSPNDYGSVIICDRLGFESVDRFYGAEVYIFETGENIIRRFSERGDMKNRPRAVFLIAPGYSPVSGLDFRYIGIAVEAGGAGGGSKEWRSWANKNELPVVNVELGDFKSVASGLSVLLRELVKMEGRTESAKDGEVSVRTKP